ncbi:MAG: alpha/beta hydrolase [Myxococcota bacterium]
MWCKTFCKARALWSVIPGTMSGPIRIVAALLGLLVLLIYFGPMIALVRHQEKILFPYPTVSTERLRTLAAAAGAQEVAATTADGLQLYGWHLKAAGRRVLLYFHGNGESVAFSRGVQRAALAQGWDFVSVSPRGYPGSEGSPSPEGLALDARAAWDLVTGPLGYAPDQVVVHGRSLGGGMAGTLLDTIEPAGLVMESTFRSFVSLGRRLFPLYPIRLLLRYRAPTEDVAPRVGYPVLILHGDQDEVIPVSHGQRLAERFPDSRYVEIAGFGHNDNLLLNDPTALAAWRTYLDERLTR